MFPASWANCGYRPTTLTPRWLCLHAQIFSLILLFFNNLLEQVEVATFVYPNTWKCWTKGAFWLSTRQISEEWNLNNMRIRHILIRKCYILSIWAGSCRIETFSNQSLQSIMTTVTHFVFSQNNMETVQNRPIVSSAGSIIISSTWMKWAVCFCCHVLRD